MLEIRKLPYNYSTIFCPNSEKPHINKWTLNLEKDSLFIIKPYQIDPMKDFCIMKVQFKLFYMYLRTALLNC